MEGGEKVVLPEPPPPPRGCLQAALATLSLTTHSLLQLHQRRQECELQRQVANLAS